MKVRANKEYFDKEMKKTVYANTEFEVNEVRGGVLLAAGVVEDITEDAEGQTVDVQGNAETAGEQPEEIQEDTEAAEEQPKPKRKKKAPKDE